MAGQGQAAPDGRAPIAIGVTGHRSIAAAGGLAEAVAQQCLALREKYPSTPFLVLSSLAEGADRIVADIAMKTLGAALIAILPMPRAEFEEDFETEASRAEFARLLGKAESVLEVPTARGDGWKQKGDERDVQYAKSGAAIAEHSQILFALWDGRPARGVGGSADVAGWFNRGYAPKKYSLNPEDVSPLDPPAPGLLIHLDPATGALIPNREETRRKAERLFALTDKYNKAVQGNRALIDEKAGLIRSAGGDGGAGAAAFTGVAPQVDAVYRAADVLSVRLARQVRRADAVVYATAILAFCLFNFLDQAPLVALAYLGAASGMAALTMYIRARSVEDRFQEYRALAEAMRVLFFWRLAGIGRPVWLAYLSRHSGVAVWLRHAVRSVEFRHNAWAASGAGATAGAAVSMGERLAAVRKEWIDGQIAFFDEGARRHGGRHVRLLWISRGWLSLSYGLAVTLALAALVLVFRSTGWMSWEGNALGGVDMSKGASWLQFILGAAAAIGLAVRGYMFRLADYELQHQYRAEKRLFILARDELDRVGDPASDGWSREDILARLGVEALQESGEWLWLRHARPFEVPQ